jgi:hypothetical protein
MLRHKVIALTLAVAMVVSALAARTEAHKAITSPYNYNDHVFPILRDRCGSCHFAGGPAPMSLVDYLDAVPWAESIRERLIDQQMPPWYVDPTGPAVKGGHPLPTKELNILLDWAVGGTPRADEKNFVFGTIEGVKSPSYAGPPAQWTEGTPDLTIRMPAENIVPAGTLEQDVELTLSTGLKEDAWVKAVDLLPGERSMVRDAVISVENGPLLAAWVPGDQVIAAASGTAFKVPAGTKLKLKIHYKKNWNDQANAKSDRSTIGLYFGEAPLSGRSLEATSIGWGNGDWGKGKSDPLQSRRFAGNLKTGARVVALTPSFDQVYASVSIDALTPSGRRVALLRLRSAQPQWYRRYWLQEPTELPAGTKIEVAATPAKPDDLAAPVAKRYPLQVGIDYVSQ